MTKNIANASLPKRWLSLTDAAKYANVGKRKIREMISNGKIKATVLPDKKNDAWIIDRYSIDTYYEGLCDPTGIEIEASKILKSMK